MAAIANLSIDAGATFTSDVLVQNDDGTAFSLTGYTAQGKMSKGYSVTYERVYFDITIYEADGIVTIALDPTTTAQLEDGRWVYDVEITNTADSTVTRVVEGIITVYPGVVSTYNS
jgi:hypothetical protein